MLVSTLLPVYLVAFVILLVIAPSLVQSVRLYGKRNKFRCRQCGTCCRFKTVPVTADDIRRLESAGYTDFVLTKPELSLRRVNGRCVFVKDDKCTVYEHRPNVCREYPFFRIYGVGYAARASFCPAMEALKDE